MELLPLFARDGENPTCHVECLSPWLSIYTSPLHGLLLKRHRIHSKSISLHLPCCHKHFFQPSRQTTMINTKRIIEMARKSQKVSVLARKRSISASRIGGGSEVCSTSVASKGHLFVYTIDGERFMIPLEHLTSNIFRELFKISEEEFGLPSDGPITLPCDASSMEYVISLLRCQVSREVERVVLTSIANNHCSDLFLPLGNNQQRPMLYGF